MDFNKDNIESEVLRITDKVQKARICSLGKELKIKNEINLYKKEIETNFRIYEENSKLVLYYSNNYSSSLSFTINRNNIDLWNEIVSYVDEVTMHSDFIINTWKYEKDFYVKMPKKLNVWKLTFLGPHFKHPIIDSEGSEIFILESVESSITNFIPDISNINKYDHNKELRIDVEIDSRMCKELWQPDSKDFKKLEKYFKNPDKKIDLKIFNTFADTFRNFDSIENLERLHDLRKYLESKY